jgi:ribosomal protein S18 acetylase RimI-like enzyme
MRVHLATDTDLPLAAQLLHDFNTEYDEPTPPPHVLAARLRSLQTTDVLLAGDAGVVVLRYQAALWSEGQECYLAELYVRPDQRGRGIGRALLAAAIERARQQGADYMHLGTTEDDVAARHLYEAMGFRRTEGDDGPLMFVYEMDLA